MFQKKKVTPDLSIAGPIIDSLKYNGHKPELSELFAGLLAGAMTDGKRDMAHPAFVEFIKSISTLDARVFVSLANRQVYASVGIKRSVKGVPGTITLVKFFCPQLVNTLGLEPPVDPLKIDACIENLARLRLIDAREGVLTAKEYEEDYKEIEDLDFILGMKKDIENDGGEIILEKGRIMLTQLGKNFRSVALSPIPST